MSKAPSECTKLQVYVQRTCENVGGNEKIAKCYETDNRFGRCTLLLLSYSPSITVKVQNGEVYGGWWLVAGGWWLVAGGWYLRWRPEASPQPLSRASLGSGRPSTLVEGGIYMPGRARKSAEIHESCLGASSPAGPASCLNKIVQICSIFWDKLHFLMRFLSSWARTNLARSARKFFSF